MLLLEHTCDIYRNTTSGSNGRRSSTKLVSGQPCLAIPMPAPVALQNGFDIGKAYDFYFDTTADLKVKDKLVYAGNSYTVGSIETYVVPLVNHIHVMASREIGS